MRCAELRPAGHTTQPPARFTEASLVKELEERGIGRPSTYVSVIETILARDYVFKKGTALVPTWKAFAKVQLLERHFAHLIDYDFTATMEEALDAVARGEGEAEKWLDAFYFGNGQAGLRELVSDERLAQIDMAEVNSVHIGADAAGHRAHRAGVAQRRAHRARRREGADPRRPRARRAHAARRPRSCWRKGGGGPRDLGADPDDRPDRARAQRPLRSVRAARRAGAGLEGRSRRARRSSRRWNPTRSRSRRRCSSSRCPRVVGVDTDGEEITAQNGRYGPYIKKGTDSRSLESEDQIFAVTLRGGAGDLRPAQAAPRSRGEAADRRARSASRDAARRCACSTVASVRTSPTAPPTPPCRVASSPKRSRSTRRSSCSPNGRRAGPTTKKATAKKSTAKKAPAKKTAAKKTPAKKTTAKKAPAKRATRKATTPPAPGPAPGS